MLNPLKNSTHISVLIVPDGQNRTFGFRLHATFCKVFALLALLCLAGVVFGIVTYLRVARLALQTDRLKNENEFLRHENAKVLQLQKTLYEMEEIDFRLRTMAGLRVGAEVEGSSEESIPKDQVVQHVAQRGDQSLPVHMKVRTHADVGALDSSDWSETTSRTRPNLWPVQGWVTAEFNLSTGPLGRKHTGIDIAAPTDTPVKAAADGIVIFVGWTEDLGHLILIQHDSVFSTRYGHNSRVLVHQGEKVRRGQTIAFVGSSGRSSAPHLHFEIWKDGRPVNPRWLLLK